MPTGSLVYVKKNQLYKPGDIVTFKNKANQIVTHRIVDTDGEEIITKGDANKVTDAEIITVDQVLGKTLFAVPHIGSIVLDIKHLIKT